MSKKLPHPSTLTPEERIAVIEKTRKQLLKGKKLPRRMIEYSLLVLQYDRDAAIAEHLAQIRH